ncbi:SMP-30/gluconolactonase/LRE family protein [Acuticoccus yangtzensis]|uniref:SMP-30/gluconolactonase/LRE family protein n=1 Tax=Acuticoccus yangtzensis TaxID=1443441 RepID=UPI0009499646|nr:SMP-30/gluconolactonase/LRE family protein [Acuticoccus yangtzensis]
MTAELFDDRACELGEGALWHPERGQLFWFDILGRRLLSRGADGPLEWPMGELTSAAGWIDRDTLLLASETGFFTFDIITGAREMVAPLEADHPANRSNDGRADPAGGFWIGTMGKAAEPGHGGIWRFYKGEVRLLFDTITIPNSICFAPDGSRAFFADTPTQMIRTVPLDEAGWPAGTPTVFLDLTEEKRFPDGAVTDAEGGLWSAQWGSGRVARYFPDGTFDRAVAVPAHQSTCPAFGGTDFATLYITSAWEGLDAREAVDGQTFSIVPGGTGRAEPRVLL